MLESNFEMYPNAKDAAEVLNKSVKKRYQAQCQFSNTEVKQAPRPVSAIPPPRTPCQKKVSDVKRAHLVGSNTVKPEPSSLVKKI